MSALEVPTADPAAVFQSLYETLHATALARVRRRIGSHEAAEDVMQEAWRKVFGALPEYLGRPDFNGRGFVYTVADRLALDHLRKGQSVKAGGRVRFSSLDAALDAAGDAAEAAAVMVEHLTPEAVALGSEADADLRGQLGVGMEAIPGRLRRVLWLQVYGEMTVGALAATLGVSEASAKSAAYRAREALRSAVVWDAAKRARGDGLAARLDRMADPSPGADACWLWRGGYTSAGQAQPALFTAPTRYDGRSHRGAIRSARRLRWALEHGPIPPWTDVVHVCRTRGCTNPAHLSAAPALRNWAQGPRPRPEIEPPVAGPVPGGAELRARRLAAGLTLEAVAARIGCRASYLGDVEAEQATPRRKGYAPSPTRRLPIGQLRLNIRRRAAAVLPPLPAAPAGLRERREALGLSLNEFAAEAGCARATVGKLETGWLYPRARERGYIARPTVSPSRARVLATLDRLERERGEGAVA